jgi:hypothetical protein
MITFRKQAYFDKYLGIINEKSRTLKKYGYYIKIPAKYDLKYWLLAALKKKLFDVDTPKVFFTTNNKEATPAEVFKMKMGSEKGGILIFPCDVDIMLRYVNNFQDIFTSRAFKTILKKYPDGILWNFGKRYRGVYKNKFRNKVFNSSSNTLEFLGLNSIDLINIAVRFAVQFQQSIILIKDLNNETMIILGKQFEKKQKPSTVEELTEELTNFDFKKLKLQYNESYKLCSVDQYKLWEMGDVYPKLNEFWIENGHWFGK